MSCDFENVDGFDLMRMQLLIAGYNFTRLQGARPSFVRLFQFAMSNTGGSSSSASSSTTSSTGSGSSSSSSSRNSTRRRAARILSHVTNGCNVYDGSARKELVIEPLTPALGAIVYGADLRDTSDANMQLIDKLFLRHKVLFFREQTTEMTTDHQTTFVQALNSMWTLHAETKQQQYNYQDGLFVIRMLKHEPGRANVWPVVSRTKTIPRSAEGNIADSPPTATAAANVRTAASHSALSQNSLHWVAGSRIQHWPAFKQLVRRPSELGYDMQVSFIFLPSSPSLLPSLCHKK